MIYLPMIKPVGFPSAPTPSGIVDLSDIEESIATLQSRTKSIETSISSLGKKVADLEPKDRPMPATVFQNPYIKNKTVQDGWNNGPWSIPWPDSKMTWLVKNGANQYDYTIDWSYCLSVIGGLQTVQLPEGLVVARGVCLELSGNKPINVVAYVSPTSNAGTTYLRIVNEAGIQVYLSGAIVGKGQSNEVFRVQFTLPAPTSSGQKIYFGCTSGNSILIYAIYINS